MQTTTLKAMVSMVVMVAVAFICSAVLAEPLAYKVSDAYLTNKLTEGGELSLVVPQFYIFDRNGRQLMHTTGLSDSFIDELETGLAQKPQDGVTATALFATMTDYDDQAVTVADDEYDYLFVEYWAEWCSPCLKQMELVKKFIAERPDQKIVWVKVEQDPGKLSIVRPVQMK